MHCAELPVLRTLGLWRQAGHHAVLATVVRTWGSSPRPVGSLMALRDDGLVVGSVSGGCVEDDLIVRYARPPGDAACSAANSPASGSGVDEAPARFVKYGVTADEAHRFGLPCGGTLELLLEFDPDAASLLELADRLDSGKLVRRRVRLADGASSLEQVDAPTPLQRDEIAVALVFGPRERMLLIGAGQLAECLATMASFSGFAVTVCDPRPTYREAWAMTAVPVVTDMPDDAVVNFRPDRRSCVIALTHDPKLDDLALLEALRSEAFYVGAIGSRRNSEARRSRLREHFGVGAADLARLRGPIGIYIGSRTPAEIAVSVMAEVLALRNDVTLPPQFDILAAKSAQDASGCGAGVASPAGGAST